MKLNHLFLIFLYLIQDADLSGPGTLILCKITPIFGFTRIWRSAFACDPPDLNAEHFGWYLNVETNILEPVILPANVLLTPLNVLKIIKCGCSSSLPCSTSRCNCSSAHLSCSIFCPCHANEDCKVTPVNNVIMI